MKHRVHTYLEHRTLRLNQRFTYLADISCINGMRVKVPFGNQEIVGIVVDTEDHNPEEVLSYELKEVLEVLDDQAVLNDELIDLALWLAKETLAPTISCFQAMLPKLKNIRSSQQSIKQNLWVKKIKEPQKFSDKQKLIWDAFKLEGNYTELKKIYGAAIDTLIKNGYLLRYEKEASYLNIEKAQKQRSYNLSVDQVEALDKIRHSEKVVCLFGKTGSGKTEVYLQLAQEALDQNKQALICVPEIGLTPQMVERVQKRFGQDVIVYHSHLNDTERYLQYKRVLEGEKTIVVGTRSAIFLPFQDLSLIVIDEEHDSSYKQESHPRYHIRDIAIKRAETHGATLVLGSATPAFETFARAVKGNYELVRMPNRVSGSLPKIHYVSPARYQKQILSDEIVKAIQKRMDDHEQILCLINRRGYTPILQCSACQKSVECPNCDRLLHVHKTDHKLKCHSCGYERELEMKCPSCGSSYMRMLGLGTQKVEEELHQLFPTLRVIRMDRDSTTRKHAHENILSAFEKGEADMLLGTQMIAKGLDMPKVSLSIILEIDQSLLGPDYRSVEDAFSLLVQSAGRAGRLSNHGEVYVSTRMTEHYALKYAQNHDYEAFFSHEMQVRHQGNNPPYSYLLSITLSSTNEEEILNPLHMIKDQFDPTIRVLGPSDLGKLQNRYRARLILKGKDLDLMRENVKRLLPEMPIKQSVDVVIDINPRSLLV